MCECTTTKSGNIHAYFSTIRKGWTFNLLFYTNTSVVKITTFICVYILLVHAYARLKNKRRLTRSKACIKKHYWSQKKAWTKNFV